MTQITDKVFASPVPQDKTCQPEDMTFANFYPHALKEVDEIIWIKCNGNSFTQKIPPGSYRFLFTTKSATEEDARKVVETIHIEEAPSPYNDFAGGWRFGYVDYENRGEFSGYQGDAGSFGKSIDSLHSLLRSKNLDDKNNYALIEKLK